MEKNSILYLLKSQDVSEKTITLFREKLNDKNFTLDDCDKLLKKLGYENIFGFENDIDIVDEDQNSEFEPIRTKRVFIDE